MLIRTKQFCLVLLLTTCMTAGSNKSVTIDSSRPLADAAQLLQEHYGVPISYEDPAWAFGGDMIDQIDPTFKLTHSAAHAFVPRGGVITVVFDSISKVSPDATNTSILSALSQLIDTHRKNGNPGSFRIVVAGTGFSIVPSAVKDENGELVQTSSPLDTLIDLPIRQRTGMETLQAICDAVTNGSGQAVGLGVVPLSLKKQTVSIGATQEAARSVLTRTLDGIRWSDPELLSFPIPKMYWQLFNGQISPYDMHTEYVLNLGEVFADKLQMNGILKKVIVNR